MQGGKHQVAGHRGAQADLRGLRIAHFTDQDHIRVLPQSGAQHARKCQVDLFVYLHLIDAGQAVFHRVFHGDDLLIEGVDLGQRGIKGGGLAATGRPRHQYHAVAAPDDLAEAFEHVGGHTQLVQADHPAILTQQPHHHRFAVLRGTSGDAHIHALIAHPHMETSVLRQALFGDIQAGHQLEAQHQCGSNFTVGFSLQMQHAVDAKAYHHPAFLRFDMNVRSLYLRGIVEHGLQQLDHRRLFHADGIGQRAKIHIGVAYVLTEFTRQPGDFIGAPVTAIYAFQQLPFSNHSYVNISFDDARDFIKGGQIGRISHADQQHAIALFQHDRAETPRLTFRQQPYPLDIDVVVLEIDVRDAELLGERLGYVLLGDEGIVHQHAPQLASVALLLLKSELELVL